MTSLKTPHVGECVPDFMALTSKAEEFRLNQCLENGYNVGLLFYRGHW